jgi:multidrug resistance efflux pump
MVPEDDLTEPFRDIAASQFTRLVQEASQRRSLDAQSSCSRALWALPEVRSQSRRWPAPDMVDGSYRAIGGGWRIPRKKVTVPALLLVSTLLGIIAGCSSAGSQRPDALPTLAPVGTVAPASARSNSQVPALTSSYTVGLGDVEAVVSAAGQVMAAKQAQVGYYQAGAVTKVDVSLGQQVKSGDVLVELAPTGPGGDSASDALTAAQANVAKARMQISVDDAKIRQAASGGPDASNKAAVTLAEAQAKLDGDQGALDKLKSGPDPNVISAARAVLTQQTAKLQAVQAGIRPEQRDVLLKQIEGAKNGLFSAQTARDGACNKANPDYQCSAANATVNQAQTAVDTAAKQYQLAIAGPTSSDLQQAQAAVDEAQAHLDTAQAPPTPQQIAQAQSLVQADTLALQAARASVTRIATGDSSGDVDVLKAQRSVDELTVSQAETAVARLQAPGAAGQSGRTLVSPIDGVVIALNAHVGDVVQAGGLGAVVADPSSTQIVVNVSDTDLARVKPGEPVQVTLAATPDKPVAARVASVARVGNAQADKIIYPVTLALDGSASLDLGMSARAQITTGTERNVVVVPNQYLRRDGGKASIQKLVDGKSVQAPVTIGLVGISVSQIVDGLQPGDQITLGPFTAPAVSS